MPWYDLCPYQTDKSAGEDNMYRILDHLEKFLVVFHRDGRGRVRIAVRCNSMYEVVMGRLEGIELVPAKPFAFGAARYRKYLMKRHCAVPIIPKTMKRFSIFQVLNAVSERCFLAIYAKKTYGAPPINEYVRCLNRGQNPESWLRFFGNGGSPSLLARTKIQLAQEKSSTGNLFAARMFSGYRSVDAARSIEGVFPSKAFVSKTLACSRVRSYSSGNISIPLFGSSRFLILSDAELLGFLTLPNTDDLASVNFEMGRPESESAGLPIGTSDPDNPAEV